jgi:hypothetical protein
MLRHWLPDDAGMPEAVTGRQRIVNAYHQILGCRLSEVLDEQARRQPAVHLDFNVG